MLKIVSNWLRGYLPGAPTLSTDLAPQVVSTLASTRVVLCLCSGISGRGLQRSPFVLEIIATSSSQFLSGVPVLAVGLLQMSANAAASSFGQLQ